MEKKDNTTTNIISSVDLHGQWNFVRSSGDYIAKEDIL